MPKITSSIHDTVYNSLFDLMGTTSTGYGAVLIGDPVNAGDKVKAHDWNNIIQDVERCLIHQTGTSTNGITIASTGSIAKFVTPAKVYSVLQTLQQNIGTASPSQLDSFTFNTTATSDSSWTNTNFTNTVAMRSGEGYISTVKWAWFYDNQLNYFFNLGGKIQPEISISSPIAKERNLWQSMINVANQHALFTREQFLQALENPQKTYTYYVTSVGAGSRQLLQRLGGVNAVTSPYATHLTYSATETSNYSAVALTVTYRISGNSIVGMLNFVAGQNGKKKKKQIFRNFLIGKKKGYDYIRVNVQITSDFRTTYATGANGGIAAQIPQTHLVSNALSPTPSPIPQFTIGVGQTTNVQAVTLRNNNLTQTCVVSDIVLRGYTTGTVYPTSFTLPPISSATFYLSYSGAYPGHHRGLVDVVSNLNGLTLFTEINVGSTDPVSLNVTTSTYDLISQDFVVDHAGGYFKDFNVSMTPSTGFALTELVPGTKDKFNITFNPRHLTNGAYISSARVTVNPLDSSQIPTVWDIPLLVSLNVENRHIADWRSCTLGTNTVLGISYDVIGGKTYITAGLGYNNPNMVELRSDELTFNSWFEVCRIPLDTATRKVYSGSYVVKSNSEFKFTDYFGVGNSQGSLLTLAYDGLGNIDISMNTVRMVPPVNSTEVLDLSTAFRYYDSRRTHQLQSLTGLTQGNQTFCFTGFDRTGETLRSLVSPN